MRPQELRNKIRIQELWMLLGGVICGACSVMIGLSFFIGQPEASIPFFFLMGTALVSLILNFAVLNELTATILLDQPQVESMNTVYVAPPVAVIEKKCPPHRWVMNTNIDTVCSICNQKPQL